MQDQLRDLLERPSRVIGWGVVAAIHLLMWQVLSHGLNLSRLAPVLEAVQVSFVDKETPPVLPQQPSIPNLEVPVTPALFVSPPEVNVTHESTIAVATAPIAPPAVAPAKPAMITVHETDSTQLLVVSESEVDYLVRPEIRYPLAAKRAKEQGTVLLSVIVDERGLVNRASIYQSSGSQRLDEVALRAVRSLRVKPYIRNGMALPIEIRVPVEFSLNNAV